MVQIKNRKQLLIDIPFEEWKFKGLPTYRNKQIREWIYEKGILEFEKMSNLSLGLREELKKEWDLMPIPLA